MLSVIHDVLMLFYLQVQSLSYERHGKNTFDFWNVSESFMITFAHISTQTLRYKIQIFHIYPTKRKEIRPLGCKYRSAHAKLSYLCQSRSELTCLFQCQEKKGGGKGGDTCSLSVFGVYTLLFATPAISDPNSTARPAHPLTGLVQMELFWRLFQADLSRNISRASPRADKSTRTYDRLIRITEALLLDKNTSLSALVRAIGFPRDPAKSSSILLFLARLLVIKYKALQEDGYLLLDVLVHYFWMWLSSGLRSRATRCRVKC